MSRDYSYRFSPSEAYRAFVKAGIPLPDDLLTLPSIEISNHKTLPKVSGVYFFLLDGEPVYIGESCNIKSRICSHPMRQTIKDWRVESRTRLAWIEVSAELRGGFQCAAILKWCPPYGIDYGLHIVMDKEAYGKKAEQIMVKIHQIIAEL